LRFEVFGDHRVRLAPFAFDRQWHSVDLVRAASSVSITIDGNLKAETSTAASFVARASVRPEPQPLAPVPDATPPTLSGLPQDATLKATGPNGANDLYSAPTAIDEIDGARPVTCDAVDSARDEPPAD
jgi:hypothetical protein